MKKMPRGDEGSLSPPASGQFPGAVYTGTISNGSGTRNNLLIGVPGQPIMPDVVGG